MVFFTTVSLCAALSFLYFGGRLVVLLRRVDIISGTRGVYSEVLRRRLREVAGLSIICTTSFLVRCAPRRPARRRHADRDSPPTRR